MKKQKAKSVRYHTLDELRGFAVFCMVFYHAFFTMASFLELPVGDTLYNFFMPAEPFFAAFFIFLSGICCEFSHSNLKRGGILLIIALLISAVTFVLQTYCGFDDCFIWFGILHLLSISMIIEGFCGKIKDHISHPIIFILIFLLLFFLTFNVEIGTFGFGRYSEKIPDVMYDTNYMFPLGFHSNDFYSADYFPLLPWVFMFFAGSFTGLYARFGKFPKFLKKRRIRPLAFIGRHSLLIYILHQPVIYAVAYLTKLVVNDLGGKL